MNKKFFIKFKIIFILVAACLLTSSLIVYGWTGPSLAPPGGNVSRPLHVGPEGQEKAGGLWLNTGGAATGLIIEHGNVGIGTTSPEYKLDVSGTLRATGAADFGSTGTFANTLSITGGGTLPASVFGRVYIASGLGLPNYSQIIFGDGTGYRLNFAKRVAGVTTNLVTIRDTGMVGIGETSPGSSLSVVGGISVGDATYAGTAAPTEGMIIKGNVGIGTTTPAQKLHVAGYARADSGFCIGTSCITAWPEGEVTGTGTTNYLPIWTTSSNIGNSVVYQLGTNIGIGTTSFATGEKLAISNGTTKLGIFPGYLDSVADAGWVTLDIPSTRGLRVWDNFSVSGNVGIGTTSPAQKLHVAGYARADSGFCIGTSCITAWPEGEVTGTGTANYLPIWTTSSNIGNSVVYQSGTNVGIGMTSPSYKLDISSGDNPGIRIGPNSSYGTSLLLGGWTASVSTARIAVSNGNLHLDSSDSSHHIYLNHYHSGNVYMVSGSSQGNVGIGTTTPAQKLHVAGYARADSGFCIGTSCITAWPEGEVTGTGTANYLPIWTTSSNIGNSVVYQSGSNVGIGTTSPGQKLHIESGDLYVEGADNFDATDDIAKLMLGDATGVHGVAAKYDRGLILSTYKSGGNGALGPNGYDAVLIANTTGNVGIGTTTPAQKLHVAGYARADSGFCIGTSCITAWPEGEVTGTGTANYLPIWTTSSNIGNSVVYQSGTQVGIGLTNPGYALEVSGDVKALSFLSASDASLKMGIGTLGDDVLGKVTQLRGISFNWKDSGEASIGFLAEEVEKIFPEVVFTDRNGIKSIDYSKLVAPLTEAIKEQQKQAELQQQQIDRLIAEIEELKKINGD